MKRTLLPTRLKLLLQHSLYATVATADASGHPWNTPLRVYMDDHCNIYWMSHKSSQHSQNIADNPHVFAVFYDSRAVEGEGLGLYMDMLASEVTPENLPEALKVYDTAFLCHEAAHQQFAGECPQRLYKAVAQTIWYNDASHEDGHFSDFRIKLPAG